MGCLNKFVVFVLLPFLCLFCFSCLNSHLVKHITRTVYREKIRNEIYILKLFSLLYIGHHREQLMLIQLSKINPILLMSERAFSLYNLFDNDHKTTKMHGMVIFSEILLIHGRKKDKKRGILGGRRVLYCRDNVLA